MNQKRSPVKETGDEALRPFIPLLRSFAGIVGLPIKLCGCDGRLLAAISPIPAGGPCAFFSAEGAFRESCAASHAAAIETARSLRRPYIFTCHARLAGWAIPILLEEKPAPASIICGGALLMEPDAALAGHLRAIAAKHGLDPRAFIRSLDDLPVVSRDYFRTVSDFLFALADALLPGRAPDAVDEAPPAKPAFSFIEQAQLPLVFPPERRKEAKKERARRNAELHKQNAEQEVARFLRERRQDEALRALQGLLARDPGPTSMPRHLRADAAEVFARLFRVLAGARIDPDLQEQQAVLLKDALALKRGPEEKKNLARLSERFVQIAGELVGGPRPRRLKAIQKYLERNLSKKLSLGTVGGKFGMKEKPLNELILLNCGMSFTDYVASLRVTEAKRLLKTTDLTLGQIAKKIGFTDQSYFTKVFKATAGTTPSEFRKG